MSRFLAVPSSSVAVRSAVANSGAPECDFTAGAGGRRVRVSVAVDSAPQPYQVLERAAVEEAQVFGTRRVVPAPQAVGRLGLDAYWFPAEQHVMTTDGVRLITATVSWPSARQSRRRALAVAAARPYLGRPQPRAAQSPGG